MYRRFWLKLLFGSGTAECEKLMELYERLEELDADKAAVRASRLLYGLGFTPAMQRKKLKDFSGGWRMRVSLARWEGAPDHNQNQNCICCQVGLHLPGICSGV